MIKKNTKNFLKILFLDVLEHSKNINIEIYKKNFFPKTPSSMIKKNLQNPKINHIVALPEEFATFWYQFREDRSTNVEVVRGHTDRQTDGAYIYRYKIRSYINFYILFKVNS